MTKRSKALFRLPIVVFSVLSFLSDPVSAENLRVTEATDYWFSYEEPTTFFARTYAVDGIPSDPMLWLYGSDGTLLTANDDFHGLQSQLEYQVPAGQYRLRAGVCCGDPNRWYQGVQYDISYNGIATSIGSTTTTTVISTTTTEETVWTTTTVLTPIVTVTTTTSVAPTTTEMPTTTTTAVETTITTLIPQEQSNVTTTSSIAAVPRTSIATTTTTVPAPTTTLVATTAPPTTTTVPSEPENANEGAIRALQESSQLTVEVLKEVLGDIDVSEMTEEQEIQLVLALNVANEEVKKAFEAEVDVYSEGLDEYVPSGSVVPVKTRRVLIATAGLFMTFPTVTASSTTEVRRKK